VRSLFAAFAKPPPATIAAASAATRTPTQGLIQVTYDVSLGRPGDATLEVLVNGAATPALRTPLGTSDGAASGAFALHGHLLANGPARLTLRVTRDGRTLATQDLVVHVRNEGEIARLVAESLKASGTPLAVEGPIDSALYDYGDAGLTAWFDGPDAEAHIAALVARGEATAEEADALRRFVDQGYLVLPEAIDAGHLERLNAALDDAVARRVEGYEWGSSQRIHNLHEQYPAIRELWLHPKVMRMLALIFGEPAKPCQSLTYVFGSEQEHHQDTIHLTPFPPGRMCGVWTALEDVQPDSGELMVFPGSHRLERVYMRTVSIPKVGGDWSQFGQVVTQRWTDMINARGLPREAYRPKAGTVLIWHENLMHAGSPRIDTARSRRSIVGHYFANGAIAYYDSSGQPGSVFEGA
jgi:hypothetical protein